MKNILLCRQKEHALHLLSPHLKNPNVDSQDCLKDGLGNRLGNIMLHMLHVILAGLVSILAISSPANIVLVMSLNCGLYVMEKNTLCCDVVVMSWLCLRLWSISLFLGICDTILDALFKDHSGYFLSPNRLRAASSTVLNVSGSEQLLLSLINSPTWTCFMTCLDGTSLP